MTAPEAVYAELFSGTPAQAARGYREFHGPAGLGVRAFVDGESRLPGLAFRTTRDLVPAGMQLPKIKGATSSIVHSSVDSKSADVVYELAAAEHAFADVFVELASRLIGEASAEQSATAALLRVSRRVASWARFFDARGSEGLGRSAQLGLLGELLCLEKLGSLISFNWAVASWTGPEGTPHDFQAEGGAIEVKLTTSSSPERFRISSERQLDETVVPWLGMYAITAQEAAAGAVSLCDVVDRLRLRIDEKAPSALGVFDERLLQAGFSESDRQRYTVRITTRAAEFLHVNAEFPRIRPFELRPGVFAVSYEIPWLAIAPYRIPESYLRSVFRVADE